MSEMNPVSEQKLTPEQRELVDTVYNRLELFEPWCRPFHETAKEMREVLRLRDPKQDDADVKERTLQLQTLKSTFNNCVADQMQNMPEPKLIPETPELNDVAMDLQDAVRYVVYNVNKYNVIHRRRTEDLYATGTAITQVTWDETMCQGKGDIAIIRWPVEAFLWDPQAENIQDARAVMKVSWHPLSWFRAHYPDAAAYVAAEDGAHNQVGLSDIGQMRANDDEGRAALLEYWYREYDASKKRYSINVAYCAGGALLAEQKDVFAHGRYPFVVDVHSTIEGTPVGDGMVAELVPMMRYINRYARYIDTNLRMSSKGRMFTRKNSGIDRQALADWSNDIIEGDRVERGVDWDWMQHAPLNGMVVNQMLQFQNDLKQDSGANQFTRGETTAGVTSGKAIAALQEAGGKITSLRTETLNAGFQEIVEQILWLMSEFYTDERVKLITGRDGVNREVAMSAKRFFGGKRTKGSIPPPPYMVQVEIDRRNPVLVEAQNEMYMQAYTMAAQAQQFFPLSSLFELMNIDGKDRLMPVILENENHQKQMQQLQQQNAQMMEQMAQLQKDNDNLRATSTQMTNALANVGASNGGGFAQQHPGQMKVTQAGGGADTQNALVQQTRENLMRTRPV